MDQFGHSQTVTIGVLTGAGGKFDDPYKDFLLRSSMCISTGQGRTECLSRADDVLDCALLAPCAFLDLVVTFMAGAGFWWSEVDFS